MFVVKVLAMISKFFSSRVLSILAFISANHWNNYTIKLVMFSDDRVIHTNFVQIILNNFSLPIDNSLSDEESL